MSVDCDGASGAGVSRIRGGVPVGGRVAGQTSFAYLLGGFMVIQGRRPAISPPQDSQESLSGQAEPSGQLKHAHIIDYSPALTVFIEQILYNIQSINTCQA